MPDGADTGRKRKMPSESAAGDAQPTKKAKAPKVDKNMARENLSAGSVVAGLSVSTADKSRNARSVEVPPSAHTAG